jgi:tripartite-type tricarboxylate transporter receptor subunit TctC
VPTVAETIPGFEMTSWHAVFAPAGTPPAVVGRLGRELRAILAEPEVLAQLARHGTEPAPTTPEEFGARIHADIGKWARVVREAGIQPD